MVRREKYRLGLALGSGAARGWAHIGVLRALDDLGIQPDVVCGTSMGALAGGFYLSGQLDALEGWARSLTRLKIMRYMDMRWNSAGLIGGRRLAAEMARALGGQKIEDLPKPFASVVTDLATGHEMWITEGPLVDAIRASFSLPAFFEPVRIAGRWVIDGAMVNPVPVSVCHALGAQTVVAVNLNVTNPTRNGTAPTPISSAFGTEAAPGLFETVLGGRRTRGARAENGDTMEQGPGGAPTRMGVMAATFNIVQDRVTRSRLAADPPDVTVVPRVGSVGFLDLHQAAAAIDAGAAAIYEAETALRNAMQLFEKAAV